MGDENCSNDQGKGEQPPLVVGVRLWGDITEQRFKVWSSNESLKRKFELVRLDSPAVWREGGGVPNVLVLGNSRDPKKPRGDRDELSRWLSSSLGVAGGVPRHEELPVVTTDFLSAAIKCLNQGAPLPDPRADAFQHCVQVDAALASKIAPAVDDLSPLSTIGAESGASAGAGAGAEAAAAAVEKAIARRDRLVRRTMNRLKKDENVCKVVERSHKSDWNGVLALLNHVPTPVLELSKSKRLAPCLRDLRPYLGWDGSDRGIYLRAMRLDLGHLQKRAKALREGVDVADNELLSSRFRWLRRSLHASLKAAEEHQPPLGTEASVFRYYTGSTETNFAQRMGEHDCAGETAFLGGHFSEEHIGGRFSNMTFFGEAQLLDACAAIYGRQATYSSDKFRESLKVGEALAAALVQSFYYSGGSNLAVCGYEFNGGVVIARPPG